MRAIVVRTQGRAGVGNPCQGVSNGSHAGACTGVRLAKQGPHVAFGSSFSRWDPVREQWPRPRVGAWKGALTRLLLTATAGRDGDRWDHWEVDTLGPNRVRTGNWDGEPSPSGERSTGAAGQGAAWDSLKGFPRP